MRDVYVKLEKNENAVKCYRFLIIITILSRFPCYITIFVSYCYLQYNFTVTSIIENILS